MGFKFNANDVRKGTIDFAGDFNVAITEANYLGKNKQGGEGFNLAYQVLDGSEEGKMIFNDYFSDDTNRTDGKNPTNYRALNGLFNALGGIADGTEIELKDVDKFLPGKSLAVKIREFEPNDYQGRVTYRPRVADYGKVLNNGSVVDKNTPKPASHESGKGNVAQPSPFGAPASDPFVQQSVDGAVESIEAFDPFGNN
ncbi:MAG: DUF669 domain-containing protein [Lactobacillaceae bacterium]|jgi:hypothetical protein|nr:DUF669 domain-containing protein [Lactobacillaceae bacterium]